MEPLVILVLPFMTFVFGFFPIALALMGKGDVPTALKAGIIPGIFGAIMAFYFFTEATSLQILGGLTTAFAGVYPLHVVGIILGVAAAAFLAVGFAGFVFKPEALPLTAHIVNFVGVLLILLGLYVEYWFWSYLPVDVGYIAGLVVILFGAACLSAGYSVLGKFKGAWAIMGILCLNLVLAFYLLIA